MTNKFTHDDIIRIIKELHEAGDTEASSAMLFLCNALHVERVRLGQLVNLNPEPMLELEPFVATEKAKACKYLRKMIKAAMALHDSIGNEKQNKIYKTQKNTIREWAQKSNKFLEKINEQSVEI